MPEYLAPGVYVEETSFRAKSIEGVSKEIKREVHRSFETTKRHGGNPNKLIHCIKHANGDVKRIERCTRRF